VLWQRPDWLPPRMPRVSSAGQRRAALMQLPSSPAAQDIRLVKPPPCHRWPPPHLLRWTAPSSACCTCGCSAGLLLAMTQGATTSAGPICALTRRTHSTACCSVRRSCASSGAYDTWSTVGRKASTAALILGSRLMRVGDPCCFLCRCCSCR
jgi:hypothetical protein